MQLAHKLLLYGPCRSSSLSPAYEPEVIFSKQTLVNNLPPPSPLVHACALTHTCTHTHTHSCWHDELTAPGRGWLMLVNHWGLDPLHMVLRCIHIRAKVGVLAAFNSSPLYLWLSRSLAICLVPDTSVLHGLALMMNHKHANAHHSLFC